MIGVFPRSVLYHDDLPFESLILLLVSSGVSVIFCLCLIAANTRALSANAYIDVVGSQLGAAMRTAQAIGLHRDAAAMVRIYL